MEKPLNANCIVASLGGVKRAEMNLIISDRRVGYTHVHLDKNGCYCFLDSSIDHIPSCAIDIKTAVQAVKKVIKNETL